MLNFEKNAILFPKINRINNSYEVMWLNPKIELEYSATMRCSDNSLDGLSGDCVVRGHGKAYGNNEFLDKIGRKSYELAVDYLKKK